MSAMLLRRALFVPVSIDAGTNSMTTAWPPCMYMYVRSTYFTYAKNDIARTIRACTLSGFFSLPAALCRPGLASRPRRP